MTDYLESLELSIKTSNLLRHHNIDEWQFLNLTKETWRSMGGLVKGWKEIEEVMPNLREARKQRLRETTIGKALIACRELNAVRADLLREKLFITKDDEGRFRVGRFITQGDLDG